MIGLGILEIIGAVVRFSIFYFYSLFVNKRHKDFDYYSGHDNNAIDRGVIETMNILVGIISIVVFGVIIFIVSNFG